MITPWMKQTNKEWLIFCPFDFITLFTTSFSSCPPLSICPLFSDSPLISDSPFSAYHKSLPSAHYRMVYLLSLILLFPWTGQPTLFCLPFVLIWTDDWLNRLLLGPLTFSLHSSQYSFYKTIREFLWNKSHQSFPYLKAFQCTHSPWNRFLGQA